MSRSENQELQEDVETALLQETKTKTKTKGKKI